MKGLLQTAAWATAALALWIALTDNTRPLELLVGAGCALVAGAGAMVATRAGGVTFAAGLRTLARVSAALWWIVRDSAIVLRVTLRPEPPRGRMRAVPFAPRDEGGAALAYGLGSAGPNQYVVGEDDGALLVHELVPTAAVAATKVVDEP